MRCAIVDDEPEARALLQSYVEKIPFLQLEAVCSDAFQVMEVLRTSSVELLFLDIQMPGLDGVSLVKSLAHPPQVIFTTAFPNYALEGFELNAIDYLLKPFPFERFLKAVNKARNRESQNGPVYFQFKADKRLYRVPAEQVLALEAVGDYTMIYLPEQKHLAHGSLQSFIDQLPQWMTRIHRSHAVNLQRLEFVEGNFLQVGGREVPIGASYREMLRKSLEG